MCACPNDRLESRFAGIGRHMYKGKRGAMRRSAKRWDPYDCDEDRLRGDRRTDGSARGAVECTRRTCASRGARLAGVGRRA